jgi:hypothetical protein
MVLDRHKKMGPGISFQRQGKEEVEESCSVPTMVEYENP